MILVRSQVYGVPTCCKPSVDMILQYLPFKVLERMTNVFSIQKAYDRSHSTIGEIFNSHRYFERMKQ